MSKKPTVHPDDVATLTHPAVVELRRNLDAAAVTWGDLPPDAVAVYKRYCDLRGWDRHGQPVKNPPRLDVRARLQLAVAAAATARELAVAIDGAGSMLDGWERRKLNRLVTALQDVGPYLEERGMPWPCTCTLYPRRQCPTVAACGLPARSAEVRSSGSPDPGPGRSQVPVTGQAPGIDRSRKSPR